MCRPASSTGRPRRPALTSWPTPSASSVSNGEIVSTPFCRYARRTRASTSSRENPHVVCVRSLVPNEKKSASSAIRCAVSAARGSSIMQPIGEVERRRRSPRRPPPDASASSRTSCSSRMRPDERHHDLRLRVLALLAQLDAWPRRSPGPAARTGPACAGRAAPRAGRASGSDSCIRRTAASSFTSCGSGSPARSATATLTASSVRSGRNSCSGGSISRIVVGRPSIASSSPVKSCRCSGSRASSACGALVVGRRRARARSIGRRRSPRNWCSVRHRPMPSAPGRGPARRPRRCRRWRAPASGVRSRRAAAGGGRRRPARAPPVVAGRRRARPRARRRRRPSRASRPPAPRRGRPRRWRRRSRSRRRAQHLVADPRARRGPVDSSSSAPTTAHVPMPRATTAACEVLPPRAVSTPSAAIMPCRSSGLVSRRTRMTCSPGAVRSSGLRVVEHDLADRGARATRACPGRAARGPPSASNCGNSSWLSLSPVHAGDRLVHRDQALVDELGRRSGTPRAAVRLPTRVCSSQSLPRSMVNSMSHRSR